MKSQLTKEFVDSFSKLPDRIKILARKNYRIWKENKNHPSLEFKQIHANKSIYSVRIGMGWRAIGLKHQDTMIWLWIGSHSDYDKFISGL